MCIILRVMTDYTATRKIASYEVNLYGELRLSTILRICQEVAEEHLIGFGMDHVTLMQTQNLAFLILRVGMKINRMPRDGETIIIRTQPEGNSGAQFYRSYEICSNGEKLMDVMYSNILVDSNTHKIMHPSRLNYLEIDIKQILSPQKRLGKLKIPAELKDWGTRGIRFSDIDFNGHLSNSIYGDIIEDYLPHNYNNSKMCRKKLSDLQINYIKESKLKDELVIQGVHSDNNFIMIGKVEGQRAFECAGIYQKLK